MDARVRWLFQQLPGLVDEGVLPREAAARVREHYESRGDEARGRRILRFLFGLLGAVLIGSGIILLLAHNWDVLTRPMRAGLSLGLLVAAQVLAGWSLMRRRESAGWREGTATFLTLAIGACIALISQTYGIQGDLASFLVLWALLSLPAVYVMDARIPAAFYCAAIAGAALDGLGSFTGMNRFLLLTALIAPYLYRLRHEVARDARAVLVFGAAALSLPLGSIAALPDSGDWWLLYFAGLFAGLFAIGGMLGASGLPSGRNPFLFVGGLGVGVVALILTFPDVWTEFRPDRLLDGAGAWAFVPAGMALVALWWASRLLRRPGWSAPLFAGFPLLVGAAYAVGSYPASAAAAVGAFTFDLYLFALGMTTTLEGVRHASLRTSNAGMALLAGLFLARFLDSDLSFTVRGILFILIGTAFLVMNVRLLSIRREIQT